jgi:hypothetical protein
MSDDPVASGAVKRLRALRDKAGDQHRLFWSKHYSINGLGGCWTEGFVTMSDFDFDAWYPAAPSNPGTSKVEP